MSLSSAELMIQLIDAVMRARGRLASRSANVEEAGEVEGLSRTVLTAVVMAAHPPTVPQIGRSLGYPRQTIQRLADQLSRRGLIAFIDNPDHKRARRLIATPAGQAWHRAAHQHSLAWAAEFTQGIAPQRLAETVETLRLINERLELEARRGR
jgi:DNA-binding MarR family transcriptional regulator